MNKGKFNFFVPLNIEKGGENGKLVKISGIASTDAEDSDQETLIPAGFDFTPLLKSGFLNWNHQARTTSKAICGEPTSAKIINNGKDFFIEGVIYPNEEGKNVVELAETLEKHSPNRRLGFSIEGQAIERDVLNPKRVLKARITGVAITQCPKNPNTLMNIIKGEYADEFVEGQEEENEKQVDKAMMVDQNLTPHTVEGEKKPEELNQVLKKSDIYNQIYNRYTTDFEKAEKIHQFINKVKENNMSDKITPEILEKAFAILDDSLEKSEEQKQLSDYDKKDEVANPEDENKEVNKSEEVEEDLTKSEDDDDDDDDDDDFEKAMNAEVFAKSLFDQGQTSDEVIKSMVACGVNQKLAETACANCVAQANEAKDGGNITILKKSEEENDIEKSEILQRFDNIQELFETKVDAMKTILKSFNEDNKALKEEITLLKSQNAELLQTPAPRKSISTVKALDRFEKSEDSNGNEVYSLNDARSVKALGDRLMAEAEASRANGQINPILEKAVMDLEIAKSTDYRALQPVLNQLKISIQG